MTAIKFEQTILPRDCLPLRPIISRFTASTNKYKFFRKKKETDFPLSLSIIIIRVKREILML